MAWRRDRDAMAWMLPGMKAALFAAPLWSCCTEGLQLHMEGLQLGMAEWCTEALRMGEWRR
jgi:hypothetical protein